MTDDRANDNGTEMATAGSGMWMLDSAVATSYERHVRPFVGQLLGSNRLAAVFERAEGDHLWVRRGESLVKILDLVGGYGANLLGHHHPEIVAEARRLLEEQAPILAQGSIR